RERSGARRSANAATHVGDEEIELVDQAADLRPEPELEADVLGLAVPVVVDMEGIQDVRIEGEVVGAGGRLPAWEDVHDQDDVVLPCGLVAAEEEEVGDVGRGVQGDAWRLPVARRS